MAVGEILAGVAAGRTGPGWINPDQPVLVFLARAGFALIMIVAGSHIPVRAALQRATLALGALLAAVTGSSAVPAGLAVAAWVGTGYSWLYAVLLASRSVSRCRWPCGPGPGSACPWWREWRRSRLSP
jgi:Kef-type K+ transport system membrane component KefB